VVVFVKVVDLFCGAGGFSCGFALEGFDVVYGVDSLRIVAETFSRNFPRAHVVIDDIKNIGFEDVLSIVSDVDVVIGGPPCEPFTEANIKRMRNPIDRLYSDPIGQLVLHFIRIVGDVKPRVFIMENVPQIIDGELKESLIHEFRRAGYGEVYFNILRAERYGTPSVRRRIFISNIPLKPKRQKPKVVIEAIKDLPEPSLDPEVPNHIFVPVTHRRERRIAKLRWCDALVYFRGARGVHKNWIRLHPYRLAPTVMGNSRFIHPFENRLLTPREHARLMGFPDSHVFLGSVDMQYNMIGEAVPPPLARAIAAEVKKWIQKH
jgi:DNA (cytosine-5)-methyltransferase 1